MKFQFLALSAAVLLASHVANATVYFASVSPPVANPEFGFDGPVRSDATLNVFAMADSFTSATPNFTQLSVLLAAGNPLDHGSATIYLIPDDGSGTGNGVAGNPTITVNTSGTFTGFKNAQLLGIIEDSTL